jgi:hypothetical protein
VPLAGNCGTPERHNHRRAPSVPMLYCSTAAKGSEGLLGFASLAPLSGPAPTRKNAPISAGPFRPKCRPGVIFQPPSPLPSAAGSHPRQGLPDRATPAFNPNFCRYTATLPGPAEARMEWPALGVPPYPRRLADGAARLCCPRCGSRSAVVAADSSGSPDPGGAPTLEPHVSRSWGSGQPVGSIAVQRRY